LFSSQEIEERRLLLLRGEEGKFHRAPNENAPPRAFLPLWAGNENGAFVDEGVALKGKHYHHQYGTP